MKDVRVSVDENERARGPADGGRPSPAPGTNGVTIGTEPMVDDRHYRVVSHEIEEAGPMEETVLTVERMEAG